MIRRLLFSVVLALLLVACGAAAGTVAPPATAPPTATTVPTATPIATAPPATAAPTATAAATATPVARRGATLWIVSGSGEAAKLVALDAATEKVLVSSPVGAPSQDWTVLYATTRAGARTTVTAYDLTSGKALRSTSFDGDYRLPGAYPGWLNGGLSYDGRTLVLQELPSAGQAQAYSNSGKWVSRFAVLDTAFTAAPKLVELQGNYRYDTMAPDGHMLYLIEAQSANNPALYGVREYDLVAGVLRDGYVVDKSNSGAIMEGYALTQVSGPGGSWVFTLYRNEKTGPFIHALGAADGFALCLDLPTAGKENTTAALDWTLAAGPHNTIIYAVNAALGLVAEVDATGPRIVRTAAIPAAPTSSHGGPLARLGDWLAPAASAKEQPLGVAAVSSDGRTLYVARADGLVAIDTATLQVRADTTHGQVSVIRPSTSLLVSPDGAQLFAVVSDGGGNALLRLDPASGESLGGFSRALNPAAVVHVAAAR